MATRTEIENFNVRSVRDLEKLANLAGYNEDICTTAFMNFLDDNPGAIECLQEWIAENLADEDEGCDEDEYEDKEDAG